MRWLRKILSVGVVIGVAALMSIPFKRVPPRETNKSTGRGQWEFVEPRLQLNQILKPGAGDPSSPAGDNVEPGGSASETRDLLPNSSPTRVRGDSPAAESQPTNPSTSASPASDSLGRSSFSSSTRDDASRPIGHRGRSDTRPIPTDDAPPIRDQEAYPMSPMSRLPRIESQPPRSERIGEQGGPPALPSEFKPLVDSTL